MTRKIPIRHGFYVRLVLPNGQPAGRLWFATARPRRRPPALVRYLRHVHHPFRVASITPATQIQRKEYDLG